MVRDGSILICQAFVGRRTTKDELRETSGRVELPLAVNEQREIAASGRYRARSRVSDSYAFVDCCPAGTARDRRI